MPRPALLVLSLLLALPAAAQTSRPVPDLGAKPVPRLAPAVPPPGQAPTASDEVKDPE